MPLQYNPCGVSVSGDDIVVTESVCMVRNDTSGFPLEAPSTQFKVMQSILEDQGHQSHGAPQTQVTRLQPRRKADHGRKRQQDMMGTAVLGSNFFVVRSDINHVVVYEVIISTQLQQYHLVKEVTNQQAMPDIKDRQQLVI